MPAKGRFGVEEQIAALELVKSTRSSVSTWPRWAVRAARVERAAPGGLRPALQVHFLAGQ